MLSGTPRYKTEYNASNELTSISAATYTYDKNGNTLTKVVSGSTAQYGWDFENRLTSVILPGTGGTVTFKYDPFGRRIQKAFAQGSTTTTTNYLYDGENSVEEVDPSGVLLARYTQGMGIDEPMAELRSGSSSYYEQDGLGSVTSLSIGTGTLGNASIYDGFGNLTGSTGTIVNPFQYTGRDYDPETGLRYYRARYYDPSVGRFLSEDPIGFNGGIDFYGYVANDPTAFADPSGTQHTPGGPWHPDPWIKFRCLETDDCPTLSRKIAIFKAVIASHVGWDAQRGVRTHTDNGDIPNFMRGLATCIAIHQAKCTNNCPKVIPVPETEPATEPSAPTPVKVVAATAGGIAAGYVVYRVVRFLPSLLPPLWWTIPANAALP